MEKDEQNDMQQTAILWNRKCRNDMGSEETKQADLTRGTIVSPEDEEAVVYVETAEGVVISPEIDEEDTAETRCKIPATGTDTTTDDSFFYDEEIIEQNFKTHRSYIETCVKVTDLIVFYDLFTAEQTKRFRQMFKIDPTGATAMAFDEIVKMENQSDKYRRLLSALKESGYPKIERILEGIILPVGSDHRQTIRRCAKDIFQNLIPKEVLPHLLSRDVISIDELEEISALERNSSPGAAALELLHVLPNRTRHWYKHFIASLIESNHEDLAETIDKDLVKEMKRAGTEDVKPRLPVSCPWPSNDYKQKMKRAGTEDLKLQPPISRPWPSNDNRQRDMIKSLTDSESEDESTDEDFDRSESGYRKVKKYDKMVRNKYCPTSWCKAFPGYDFHQTDVKGLDQESSSSPTYECSPCKFGEKSVSAKYFCHDCSEYFCQACKLFHSRMKVTRNHNIDEDFPISKSMPKSILQDEFCACEYQEVEMYCKTHVEVMCRSCEAKNHAKCGTCSINDVTQNTIDNQIKSVSQAAEETMLRLETVLKEREDGLQNLNSLIRVCKDFIYQCQRDIKGIIKNKDAPLMSQLNAFKVQQNEMFEDQIGACVISLRKLTADKTMFVQAMRKGDEKRKFISSLGLSNELKDIKNVVSALTYGFEQPHIEFNRSDFLFDVLRDGQLCDLTFSTGGQIMTLGQ